MVSPRGVSTAVSMLSPSSILMSWILTVVDWISGTLPPEISAFSDSSEAMLSALGSSGSPTIDA